MLVKSERETLIGLIVIELDIQDNNRDKGYDVDENYVKELKNIKLKLQYSRSLI